MTTQIDLEAEKQRALSAWREKFPSIVIDTDDVHLFNWGDGYLIADEKGDGRLPEVLTYCLECGKVEKHFSRRTINWCEVCSAKAKFEALTLEVECTCSRCGKPRENGFDWGAGVYRTGNVGKCEACFVEGIQILTDIIKNAPGGPLPSLIAVAGAEGGLFSKMARVRAKGRRPTKLQLEKGFGVLLSREYRIRPLDKK